MSTIIIIVNIPYFLFPTPYWLFPTAYKLGQGATPVHLSFDFPFSVSCAAMAWPYPREGTNRQGNVNAMRGPINTLLNEYDFSYFEYLILYVEYVMLCHFYIILTFKHQKTTLLEKQPASLGCYS